MAGLLLVGIVAAVSLSISIQGWRSRVTAFDLLTYVYTADAFLESGTLPVHGDTGSYGSYKPPGTAWLMMPSRLITDDPRLAEYAGSALLHIATLVGILLLTRRHFGWRTAILAVVLYGVSAHGLFLAGSLWPNGRPDFYVWVVLLALEWVRRRDARFLAAGIALCTIGMYVDMAIAPALFIFPVLWIHARPPVRVAPLSVAAALVLVVWSPYLAFEASRGFTDLRSQLLLQNVFPGDYRSAWCEPDRALVALASTDPVDAVSVSHGAAPAAPLAGTVSLAVELRDKALSNFEAATLVPFGGLGLGLLVAAGVLLFAVPGARDRPAESRRSRVSGRAITLVAVGFVIAGSLLYLIPTGAVLDPAAAGAVPTTKRAGIALAVIGLAVIGLRWLVELLDRFLAGRGIRIQSVARADERGLLVLGLVVPWIILVAVAEPGKPERFWWLWPLQVIFLSAVVVRLLPRAVPRPLAIIAQLFVIIVVLINGELLPRLDAWQTAGWAGVDAEEVRVVDYVGDRLRQEGRHEASIGYQTFIYPFMATAHLTNPRYKVGAEFDLLFWYRHQIRNSDQCAEGQSGQDEYRIVQVKRKAQDWQPRHYFDTPPDPRLRLIRAFDLYQVWARAG